MTIRYEKDEQGIVNLVLDMPGRSTNVLNESLYGPLRDAVTRLRADKELIGVILSSDKRDFIAGADLDMLSTVPSAADAFAMVEQMKEILRSLETMGKPVVAAINGSALGGGYEVSLACHHRIALDRNDYKIGLPEVKLGLLPGGGGTQRLSRMIGMQAALPILLEGMECKPNKALSLGMVDALAADRDDMMNQARTWILANPRAKQPWDFKRFKWPGGPTLSKNGLQMWAIAPSMLAKKTYGNYPAAQNILACVYEGSMVDFDTASRIETRYFAACAVSPEARNMIKAFWYQLNDIKKGGSRPDVPASQPIRTLGVLGAGMMGAGIAYSAARSGIQVLLKDVDQAAAEKGKQLSQKLLDKSVRWGRMSRDAMNEVLERITPTASYEQFSSCDLVIEAVFEDRALKEKVIGECEERIPPGAIWASNTSTLPISGLARASNRPQQFIGLHFFSPVHKMPLVEIIVGDQTSDHTLAKAFDFVLQIKKTPIVVNDSRGFYTSRVFATYVLEGIAMLVEGQDPAAIEHAGRAAGMPVGPLAVSDEVSLSLMHHIRSQTIKDLEAEGKTVPHHPAYQLIQRMIEEWNRPGKKGGKGFYDYPENEKKRLWPGLRNAFESAANPLSQDEMIKRLLFIQAIETVRCMQEGVIERVADANIGSIFGWGFAPFKGGTLQYINDFGLSSFVAESDRLAEQYGERFKTPDLLRSKVDNQTGF